jgi:hypothetical protein
MPIEYVSRFPVDDAALSTLHARAFGGDVRRGTPWTARLNRCGFRPTAAGVLRLTPETGSAPSPARIRGDGPGAVSDHRSR